MTCSPEAETRATLFLRMLTLFLSQIAVIPMMSILPGYLTSIGVSPHVTAWASSIGYAALAANAALSVTTVLPQDLQVLQQGDPWTDLLVDRL